MWQRRQPEQRARVVNGSKKASPSSTTCLKTATWSLECLGAVFERVSFVKDLAMLSALLMAFIL